MARIAPATPDQYVPLFGEDPPLRLRVYARNPALASAMGAFRAALAAHRTLPTRLLELVRLRIAFHNQCRSCMAVRYTDEHGEAVDETLVCALEQPQEAPDLIDAERAAIEYADIMATNHHEIGDEHFDRLREHFDEVQILELAMNVAFYVGFGRMAMALDLTDDLPPEIRTPGVTVAPWTFDPVAHEAGWTAGG